MGEIKLQQALEQYKTIHMPARNMAPRTRKEYLADLEDLVTFLSEKAGVVKVGELSISNLEAYLADLDNRGLAGSTRKRKTIAIRSFLTFLYRQDWTATELAKRIIPPFAEYPNPRFLTQPEYQRLLQTAGGNIRDKAIIELLLQTGLRLSELVRLTLDDIELPLERKPNTRKTGLIRVAGTNGRKGRAIPLNFKACVALSDYLNFRPQTQVPALFLNRFKRRLGGRGVQKMLYKYAEAARIKGASVHNLRHTFGIYHVVKGTSLKTIQAVLGHQDIRTTELYLNLARDVARKELQENAL